MMNNNMNGNANIELVAGDKIKLVKPIGPLGWQFVGDVYEIVKYEDGIYWFKCPCGMGCFTPNEFDNYFELYNSKTGSELVEEEEHEEYDYGYERECDCHECHCGHMKDYDDDFEIDLGDNLPINAQNILERSEMVCDTVFDNCAVVCCKLPNGYVIVEHSASVDADEFDYEEQVGICMDKIVDRVIALEAYRDMWDCMADDDVEVEIEIEDEIEVDVDDIDIAKLQKSVREIEKQRADYERNERALDDMNRKDYNLNFRMNPWWAN